MDENISAAASRELARPSPMMCLGAVGAVGTVAAGKRAAGEDAVAGPAPAALTADTRAKMRAPVVRPCTT